LFSFIIQLQQDDKVGDKTWRLEGSTRYAVVTNKVL